ncbi:LysR substrate-binding domain-containing protein [Billgrantia saliphila]|uniref:LysR substrate-binding domain-containing protein n=1 Tax=Billgrantia saliphila TaxID=1848458 RepID=UPI000CE41ABD|nr:LysR substrate-binding domain-containing protein [Halomonas saliphila]
MALNLNDLQVFVQVVDHGGFTAASRALGLPKQTLSKRVAELERRAGVRLIHRTTRSFTVTELGQELYRHAAAMLVEAEAAENIILGRLAEPSGTVRITASVPTAQQSLATLLPRIAKAYPKIRIVLHATDGFVDIVQEGYDIAIRDHLRPLPDSGLVQRRIRTETFWLVASPGYFADRKLPATPADIDTMDGLFTTPNDRSWTLSSSEENAVVTPQPRYYANEGTGLLEGAIAGLGIACLPGSMCRAAMADRTLVRILPDWSAGEITTTLLMPHRRGQLPSVRVVANLIIEQLG